MRHALLALALLLCSYVNAQDQWSKIFRTDPYLSNGYFIVNQDEWQQMDLSHIDIKIILATTMPNGTTQKTTLQSFSISDNFYGKADLKFLDSIQSNQLAYYSLTAIDNGGNTVLQYDRVGGSSSWPEYCRQTCNAPDYAWTLHLHSANGQSYINLTNATDYGNYYYFYVQMADWDWFRNHYTTSDFSIPSNTSG